MKYEGYFHLNGKNYLCKVEKGVRTIDGMSVEDFMDTLDTQTLLQFAQIGFKVSRGLPVEPAAEIQQGQQKRWN